MIRPGLTQAGRLPTLKAGWVQNLNDSIARLIMDECSSSDEYKWIVIGRFSVAIYIYFHVITMFLKSNIVKKHTFCNLLDVLRLFPHCLETFCWYSRKIQE